MLGVPSYGGAPVFSYMGFREGFVMVWTERHEHGLSILWDTDHDMPAECGRADYERLCDAAAMLAEGDGERAGRLRAKLDEGRSRLLAGGGTDYYNRTFAFLCAQWEVACKGGHRLWDVCPTAWVGVDGVPNVWVGVDEKDRWGSNRLCARLLAEDGWPVFRVWVLAGDARLPVRMMLCRTVVEDERE